MFDPVYHRVKSQGFSVYQATNSKISLHGHEYLEFAYVQQGIMEHNIDGKKTILHPGDYFIVDYGVKHSYLRLSEEKLIVRNFMFFPEFLDRGLVGTRSFEHLMNSYLLRFCYRTLHTSPTGITFHDEDKRIQGILDEITAEYEAKDYGHMEFIRCAFVKVLILTLRKIGSPSPTVQTSPVITTLIKHIHSHYKERLSLKVLAEELGYNSSYLSQKFSQEMGTGFMEYLHRVRIEQSCRLLETTDLRITTIAQEVGYEGMKYFNQIFKERLGTTPREFRSMNQRLNK